MSVLTESKAVRGNGSEGARDCDTEEGTHAHSSTGTQTPMCCHIPVYVGSVSALSLASGISPASS